MIAFIDDHRGGYGVEPICKVLPVAPSTYRAHAAKRADRAKLSARAKQDAIRKIKIRRVFAENFDVYGVRKVWRQLRREGEDIARCTVERLMRSMGLQGVIRGKPVKTTISDKAAPCPMDHVNRQFRAPMSNGAQTEPRIGAQKGPLFGDKRRRQRAPRRSWSGLRSRGARELSRSRFWKVRRGS